MKIVSVNVGLPREVSWQNKVVTTGIFKEPIDGPVMMRTLNLDGDAQADLTVHGGASKAVYAYPSEHYDYWRAELQESIYPGECLEKISRSRGCSKMPFISETDSESAEPK
jgi:MOSC domain-containing protein YiiM